MTVRALVTSASIEPADVERILARAAELGVEAVRVQADDMEALLAALDRHPGVEVMLGDVLPDVRRTRSTYSFGNTGDEPVDADAAGEEEVLELVRSLRWVQIPSVGINEVLTTATWRRAPQVAVTTASGLASTAMAQYVAASILYHALRLWRLDEYREVRDWSHRRDMQPNMLVGRTVGFLGYGGVGRRAAHIAHSLGMQVRAVRRSPGRPASELFRIPEIEALDAGPEPAEIRGLEHLDWLLSQSEYLVCTVPLTRDTRGLIGARELALLPADAVVINVSRGPVFDEPALIAALQDGRLRGASLDVFETEPLPADSPLWDLPTVMLTPHVSGTHDRVSRYTTDLFLANLERYLAGRPLLNLADRSRGY
ncbi:MAG: D-2-hydroxyacid dehydrogenase [Chloroflexi bacterium]|nr:D-2-hydroxyacid dehydrogenase [Chloroflexota bacterium]